MNIQPFSYQPVDHRENHSLEQTLEQKSHQEGVKEHSLFLEELKGEFQTLTKEIYQLGEQEEKNHQRVVALVEPPIGGKAGVIHEDQIRAMVESLKNKYPLKREINSIEGEIEDLIRKSKRTPRLLFNQGFTDQLSETCGNLVEIESPCTSLKQEKEAQLKGICDKLLKLYPYKLEFSEEENNYLEKANFLGLKEFPLVQESIPGDYITLPPINFRIPREMSSLDFSAKMGVKTSRLGLEFGINEYIFYTLNGLTYNDKLAGEYQALIDSVKKEESFKEQETDLIFKEYKIHLMPSPDHLFECIHELIKKVSEDPILRSHLAMMKVITNPFLKTNDPMLQFPSIVVYPQFGKEHAQQVLNILFEHFQAHQSLGSGVIPRFNVATKNRLVTYAQGDGYRKSLLYQGDRDLFAKLFDEQGAHFHSSLGSGFSLDHPPGF